MLVGNGRQVKFWSFVWCGGEGLQGTVMAIFCLAVDGNASFADYIRRYGDQVA